jgi:hypothetical protein
MDGMVVGEERPDLLCMQNNLREVHRLKKERHWV